MIRFVNYIFIPCILLCLFSCTKKTGKDSFSDARINRLIDSSQSDSFENKIREKYIDSAYAELDDYKNDSLTRFLYRRTTAGYYNLKLYSKAIASARVTLNKSIEAKDSATIARAYYYSADSYYGMGKLDSAFTYYTQAENFYKKTNDLEALGEVLLYKAYVYYDYGEYSLCESAAARALEILQGFNNYVNLYNCNNLIATSLDGMNDNEKALKYYNLALQELTKFKEQGYSDNQIAIYTATSYNNIGGVYVKIGEHNKAISLYNQALSFQNLKDDIPALYAKLLNNLAYAKFKSGDNSGLPQLFFKSLNLRKELNNKSGIVASNIYLGEYYAKQRDSSKAIDFLISAYKGATEIKSSVEILNSLDLLTKIDVDNARSYYDKRIEVSNRLKLNAETNRDKFARIEYETEKLEVEKQKLVDTNNLIIIVSAIALLLVGAVFMIYYLNARNKKLLMVQEQQRANEEIYQLMFDQQQKIDEARSEEKSRIAMELHDGILNNIYAVRLNLEFINKKTDEESVAKRKGFIKELQNVESEIRGVSHDLSRNSIFKDEKSFKALLEFMINSQKNSDDTFFETDIDGEIEWDNFGNVVKANIYRIIQEAIQNINKYSKAKQARITIKEVADTITVNIEDDGVGFDTDKVKSTGIGLRNLRKRASALNGSIDIISQPGAGTSVKIVFPAV